MIRAVPVVLAAAAALSVAGCFGPSEGVLIVRDGAGGSVAASGREGGMVTLQATPDEGYAFAGWRCLSEVMCPEGAEQISEPRATFGAGSELALEAVFEFASPTTSLTLADAEGGSATADCGQQCQRQRGWQVRVEALPDAGRHFRGWECEGGAACNAFNLSTPGTDGPVNGDITLTPRYSALEGAPLTLQSGDGSTVTVLADCGTACAEGRGWNASVSALPLAGGIVSGWNCTEGQGCPQNLDAVASPRFRVGDPAAIAPEISSYRISAGSAADWEMFVPAFEERTLCIPGAPCAHLIAGERDLLAVDLPSGSELEHEWQVVAGSPQIALGQQQGDRVAVSAADDLAQIVEGAVEVVSRNSDGVVTARQVVSVIAVPAALAVRVEEIPCMGQSGFVVRDGGEHYVITSLDREGCLNAVFGAERFMFSIGPRQAPLMLEGMLWGVDQISLLLAFRIPDPGLAWLPSFAIGEHPLDEPVRVVGALQDASIPSGTRRSVPFTAAEVTFTLADSFSFSCSGPGDAFELDGFPDGCRYQYGTWMIMPASLPPGFDGGPILNRDGAIVGVMGATEVRGASRITDSLNTASPIAGLGEVNALLQGGKRCIVRGEYTDPGGHVAPDHPIGVDNCSSRMLGGN